MLRLSFLFCFLKTRWLGGVPGDQFPLFYGYEPRLTLEASLRYLEAPVRDSVQLSVGVDSVSVEAMVDSFSALALNPWR
jgi:hypothetical protein